MPSTHTSTAMNPKPNLRPRERGIVLLVSLLVLLVISFSSAFILRGALFGDQISSNIKATQAAQHAAEVALRFCEERVQRPGAAAPNIVPAPDNASAEAVAWQNQQSWDDNGVEVPADVLQANVNAELAQQFNQLPVCLIERLPVVPLDPSGQRNFAFQITVRGFSPDYRRAADGNIITGAETILQSVLRMNTCEAALNQPDCP